MEPMKRLLLPLATGAAAIAFCLADPQPVPPAFEREGDKILLDPAIINRDPFDPDLERPKNIRIQVEYVELGHEKLTELLFLDDPPSADATPLRKQVQELVTKGEAKVIETMICAARSGEKALVESVNEFIYPTEYEPWELPNEVDLPDKPGGLSPDDVKALERLVTPATPTSFETRNIGSTLEVEPTLGSDGAIIDLRFTPDMTWHTGETIWVERKDHLGNVCKIQMPKIYTMRVTTALTCREGQHVLAAVLSPKDDNGNTDPTRKVMAFVKCDVIVVK